MARQMIPGRVIGDTAKQDGSGPSGQQSMVVEKHVKSEVLQV